ncbi:hypothetical protein Taro_050536 [Colocasia esculenta]|uniref:Uncharacterized protein n=1 Tax=Colocasia esculenta TaxID=4460 RepID=A0A843XDP4_COLES|nr:hypothetical protein [Colocasia esculenta]
MLSPCSPSQGCSVWGTPGCSIPAVGLPADVVIAERVATSEKASPRRRDKGVATWFPVATTLLSHPASPSQLGLVAVALTVQGGSACGPSTLWRSEVVVPVVRHSFLLGCSVSLMVTPGCSCPTLWRSGMLVLVLRLWSLVVAPVFRELLVLAGLPPHVVDSVGSAGVVFGLARVVVEAFLCFRCFFLLLWLVRDWLSLLSLVRKAHPPTLFSFSAGSECELQECVAAVAGCTCFERGCWFARDVFRFVINLRIRVGVSRRLREPTCDVAFTGAGLWSVEMVEVGIFAQAKQMLVCCVAPLVERCDTCLWLLSALCCLVANSGEVLPEFFSVGSGGGLRYVAVVLVVAFWWVFPEWHLGGSGGERLLALWVEVLPKRPCSAWVLSVKACAFDRVSGRVAGQVVFLFVCAFSAVLVRLHVSLWSRGLLWRVLPVSRVVSVIATTVLHLAEFWCLWWHPLLMLECCLVFEVLSFPPLGHLVLANAMWSYRYCYGVAALPCLAFYGSTVVGCPGRTTRMIWVRSSGAGRHCLACRGFLHRSLMDDLLAFSSVAVSSWDLCLVVVFLVGLVRAAPVELSTSACVLSAVVVHPVSHRMSEWQARQTDLSGCRGTLDGRILVAVWVAIAIRFVSRCPAPSRLGGRRLKALAGAPSPSFGFYPFLLLPEEEKFPLSFSGGLGVVELPAVRVEWERRCRSKEEVASSS